MCVCACKYIYICVCMHVCVYICMYVCTYVCMCMQVCMYVCMYVCMSVWIYSPLTARIFVKFYFGNIYQNLSTDPTAVTGGRKLLPLHEDQHTWWRNEAVYRSTSNTADDLNIILRHVDAIWLQVNYGKNTNMAILFNISLFIFIIITSRGAM